MNRIINLHYANTETTYKLPRIHYPVQVHRKINPSEGNHNANPKNLQTKNHKIMNLRFKFLNTETKEYFKPNYKPYHDLLITGNGDIYEVKTEQEHVQDFKTTFRLVTQHYQAIQYTGLRDQNQNKLFIGSIMKFPDGSVGVLIWWGDKLAIGSGPIDNYTAIDEVTEKELRASDLIGDAIQNPKFFDTYKP